MQHPRVKKKIPSNSNSHSQEDWREQMRQQITSLEALTCWLKKQDLYAKLAPRLLEIIKEWEGHHDLWQNHFRFAVSPYYLGLADWSNPFCPILKQCLPSPEEFHSKNSEDWDPLAEESHMPLPGLTHRYPDRVLWYLSHHCAVYCRFCMRKRKVSQAGSAPLRKDWTEIFSYIRSHQKIKEVILSGGDPLSLDDLSIGAILKELRQISHLYSIRIHTRMLVTLPMRITDQLATMLGNFYPITVVTHFNHAKELSSRAKEAIKTLARKGTSVLNQAVLLRGINDSYQSQEQLNLSLVAAGVRPYYLHRCDEIHGTHHFRVPFHKGIDILKQLRGRNPGIAIPRYVVDLPGGGGKVPLEPQYQLESSHTPTNYQKGTQTVYHLRNWEDKNYEIHET